MILLPQQSNPGTGALLSVLVGLLVGIAISQAAEFYTSDAHAPVRRIAQQSETGPGTAIISGLAVGMSSVAIPVFLIAIGIIIAFFAAGGGGSPFTDSTVSPWQLWECWVLLASSWL